MFNLLSDKLVRTDLGGSADDLSLPGVYAALAADRVVSFAALRPHQRHPWHALLCQLGALACLRSGLARPPREVEEWRAILRSLTPGFAADEPWHLVSDEDRPAFLQPPVGPVAALKPLATPDELDMLVTAKNHDLKGARIAAAASDDWLFALVALQTAEGFLGAGNFGVSRMNGGFANRPGIGLAPPGGTGTHLFRDIGRLIAGLDDSLRRNVEYDPDGPALIWLLPWDGETSMPRDGLHPYYVEICRRVRLVRQGDRIEARAGNSKAARLFMAKEAAGITGDPWTPIETRTEGAKALTVDARGFDYRRLSDILFRKGFAPAPLQVFGEGEHGDDWFLVCRALARGQGKTEGYHERRVAIRSPLLRRLESDEERLPLGALSQERIGDADAVRSALRFGLMVLFQNGPDRADFKPRDPSSSRHAEPFLARFGEIVDDGFFEALFREIEAEAPRAERRAWLEELRKIGVTVLREAESQSPTAATRRHRAFVRAERAFAGAFYGSKTLKHHFEETAHVA